jgi:peptide/nickel transport system substrate-binding protein
MSRCGRVPTITRTPSPNYFWDFFMGFKVDKPVVNDRAVRRAIHMAVDRPGAGARRLVGTRRAGAQHRQPDRALDYDAESDGMVPAFDRAAASAHVDEAGWRPGPGRRAREGRAARTFLTYGINTLDNQRRARSSSRRSARWASRCASSSSTPRWPGDDLRRRSSMPSS